MANTLVSFESYGGQTLTAFLDAFTGTGVPDVDGYPATEVDDGLYVVTIPESLVGEFRVKALDDTDQLAYRGYVTLQDTVEEFRCYATIPDLTAEVTADVTLLPGYMQTRRVSISHLDLYVGETGSLTVSVFDANRNPIDLTGLTLTLVFELTTGTVEIANNDLTKGNGSLGFSIPAEVVEQTVSLKKVTLWSSGLVLVDGEYQVRPVPQRS